MKNNWNNKNKPKNILNAHTEMCNETMKNGFEQRLFKNETTDEEKIKRRAYY